MVANAGFGDHPDVPAKRPVSFHHDIGVFRHRYDIIGIANDMQNRHLRNRERY
jgi:hypothetical protein